MIWLIDAGHGGVNEQGVYMTDPKRGKQFTFQDGFTFLEGVSNRVIADGLMKKLSTAGKKFKQIHDNVIDISLSKRVQLANDIFSHGESCIYLSIHSNAGKGKGWEVFTSPGQTKSDKAADVFIQQLVNDFPEWPFRADIKDGDKDKEENFTVLTDTRMPAVLVELLFFDERKQADFLSSVDGQQRIINSLFEACLKIEKIL